MTFVAVPTSSAKSCFSLSAVGGRVGPAESQLRVPGGFEAGPHILRLVIDVVQQCNLRCSYCHPGEVWRVQHLDVERIAAVLRAAERYGVLEVVLSGGEVTLHPQFSRLLEATGVVSRTAVVLITNATRVDDAMARRIGAANLARVCVSLDGADAVTHGSARGDNHARVVEGLRRIRATGRPVTVISVVHRENMERIGELSDWLAVEGLADQHHLCSPSYSGEARANYPRLRLRWDDYMAVQSLVDRTHRELAARGLFLTFNSFWPATGHRSPVVDDGRRLTLQQVSEQVKDTLLHVRPDGSVRLTAVSWGRETVGNAVVGNVHAGDPHGLLVEAERRYRDGSLGQLPREVEARHKFQIGTDADVAVTDRLIDNDRDRPDELAELIPLQPLSHLSLLENPLDGEELRHLAAEIAAAGPGVFRFFRHTSGVGLVYDRRRSHVILLHDHEWRAVVDLLGERLEPPR